LLKACGTHLDDVAKAFARNEGGARAAPFDQRIGGKRGAVNDRADLRGFDRRLGRRTPQTFDNRAFRLFVIGQNLGRVKSVAVLQCDVVNVPPMSTPARIVCFPLCMRGSLAVNTR
jgi:hypothetical protein